MTMKTKAFAVLSTVALLGSSVGSVGDVSASTNDNEDQDLQVQTEEVVEVEVDTNELEDTNEEVTEIEEVQKEAKAEGKEETVQVTKAFAGFTDVTKKSYAYDAIMYLAQEEIVKGYGNGKYGLKDDVTRGQVAEMISNYEKLDKERNLNNPYTDVKGTMFEDAILAVTEKGYMKGKGNKKFDPKATLTRAEMAVVLSNVFDLKIKKKENFWDVKEGHWATDSIYALYSNGITLGVGNNKYQPNGKVTREQYAQFLYQGIFLDEDFEADPIPEQPEPEPEPDKPTGEKPAYVDAQGHMTRAGLARLVVESVNPNVKGTNTVFWDIEKGSYTEDYIQKAIELGFIDIKDYNKGFGAKTKVDRAEVSTWMVKALAINNKEYQKAVSDLSNSDLTLLPITEFYKGGIAKKDVPYVGIALGTELFKGYADHSFRPKGTITKGGTDTIINRYKNILKKNPTSYSDLNEFREVALTGTNILSITKFELWGGEGKGFEEIKGKPSQIGNVGTSTIERMIFVDTVTKPAKGAYEHMFIDYVGTGSFGEGRWANGKSVGKGRYLAFFEYTFTPAKELSYMQVLNVGLGGNHLPGAPLEYDKVTEFGYPAFTQKAGDGSWDDMNKVGTFFKEGKKKKFWAGQSYEELKGMNGSVSGYVDDGSSFGYIIQ